MALTYVASVDYLDHCLGEVIFESIKKTDYLPSSLIIHC